MAITAERRKPPTTPSKTRGRKPPSEKQSLLQRKILERQAFKEKIAEVRGLSPPPPLAPGLLPSPPETPGKNKTPKDKSKWQEYRTSRPKSNEKFEAATIRDIAEVQGWAHYDALNFNDINWERRLACKEDPVLDLKTYFPNIFTLGFADFHLELIKQTEYKIQSGGKKAVALPRGSGKTAVFRGMIMRAMKYGLRNFLFFIGSKADKAAQTLDAVKMLWYQNKLLLQDFPEIAYAVYRCDNRGSSTGGQVYKDLRTFIKWGADEIQTPCLMLTEEDVQPYLKNDPNCVIYLKEYDRFLINSSGCIVRVSGIDGSIRGDADIHPVLLTQPRPDLILLDDIQKDQGANSPKTCEDLITLIESAVAHLSAPNVVPAMLMACTVIREGDVSDTYLNPDLKPAWAGERHGLTKQFPIGITLDTIYDEIDGVPNEQGQLWTQYKEVLDDSLRKYHNNKLANEFYVANREIMDHDFIPSWAERYLTSSKDPDMNEISAVQSLMNWRFTDLSAYLSEGENRPREKTHSGSLTLSMEEIREKQTAIPRSELSIQWNNLVAFIDVSDEVLFYSVLAHDQDFNGQFIEYGTYPSITTKMWKKNQFAGWSLLTRDFYKHHRQDTPAGLHSRDRKGYAYHRAPFDAKIYHGLRQLTTYLLNREFPVQDEYHSVKKIRAVGIDTKWGDAGPVIKQFVRETNSQQIMPYEGAPFLPGFKQLEQYNPQAGWLFEHQQFPHVTESRWVIKPYNKSTYQQRYILCDVNRFKSFLMKRLATPHGSAGCITLHKVATPDMHNMFGLHVAAEMPEEIIAGGRKKDCWKPRPGFVGDNDFLDTAVGCLCLASICGASLKHDDSGKLIARRNVKSMKQLYQEKRANR